MRCQWATTELSIPYHDNEWGVPLDDDRALFEFLILEGAQAGRCGVQICRERPQWRSERHNRLSIQHHASAAEGAAYRVAQAVGMVNDHTVDCFRYAQLS